MSHAMFPGIVIVWIIGMPLGIGAFIVGLSCAIATGYLKDNSIIKKAVSYTHLTLPTNREV